MPIPCQTPGCDHPNYHVCLVGKPDTTQQILKAEEAEQHRKPRKRGYKLAEGRSPEHSQALSEAMKERHRRNREANKERDEALVKRYKEGNISYKKVASEFGIGTDATLRILREAQARGEVIIRSRGKTIKNGA